LKRETRGGRDETKNPEIPVEIEKAPGGRYAARREAIGRIGKGQGVSGGGCDLAPSSGGGTYLVEASPVVGLGSALHNGTGRAL
jgi:hypothetical protein